ncbi:GNAT family N-acetyltransferase [Aliamphritea spongicola]|uniref:GNAT family N-acetyltransferase n=1 Tax=Aliamphritea spongicola TaxID=707589 RepID=UPI00196B1CFA|nr:GNAT family protein [Aliamphritea spongicola]MBN3563496.1 GNAT family N-acetyltransferase [Aliamphritea spongicola]
MKNGEVCLRSYLVSDDERTVAWLNDPEMKNTFGLTYQIDVSMHRKWLDAQCDFLIKAIEVNGQHIGNAILRLTPRHKSALLEIYIGEASLRGRGMGFRALGLLLKVAFKELKLHRVKLFTRIDNIAAQKMYEKAGFVLEGCERQAIYQDGVFVDQNIWGLLFDEWVVSEDV